MLWVVGNVVGISEGEDQVAWQMVGVFDTEEAALAECDNPWMFVAPTELNVPMNGGHTWPGAYYPCEAVE